MEKKDLDKLVLIIDILKKMKLQSKDILTNKNCRVDKFRIKQISVICYISFTRFVVSLLGAIADD